MLTGERRDVVVPQRAHREHVLAGDRAPFGHGDAVILDLVGVPAEPDAEHEPAVREVVEGRHGLRGDDRIALRDQADAGADDQPLRRGRRHRERDERVERALVLLAQLRVAGRRRRPPARRDVRVLRDVERVQPTLLDRARELGRTHRLVGHEHGDAEMHGSGR